MKGTYTLLLSCSGCTVVRIGKLGRFRVRDGYYLYTGSALGIGALSLEGRIARHKRRSKRLRWHVDYLTSNKHCKFTGTVYVASGRRLECRINRLIFHWLHALPAIWKFGSSDCECPSHLLRPPVSLRSEELLGKLETLYAKFGSSYSLHGGI